MAVLRARGRNFVAEVRLRSHYRSHQPSPEEIDFLMRVLSPLLSGLMEVRQETNEGDGTPAGAEAHAGGVAEDAKANTVGACTRRHRYKPGTQ